MVDMEKIEQDLNGDAASRQHFCNDPAGFLLSKGIRISHEQAAHLRQAIFQARAMAREGAPVQLKVMPTPIIDTPRARIGPIIDTRPCK